MSLRHSRSVVIANDGRVTSSVGRVTSSDRGDTLIEVLLALIVLGLASIAMLLAFTTSISASATHRQVASGAVALSTAAQEAQAAIQSDLALFTGCPTSGSTLANYSSLSLPTGNQ